MRAEDIHLSYTNPITGHTVSRDWGERYVEIDGLVLVVEHYYRSRSAWTAHLFTDHIDGVALADWACSDGHLTFAHVRRRELLKQIAECVGSEEWREKRARWMALPRKRAWRNRYRIVQRGPRDWWALPADTVRDSERGPWPSERAARAELGDTAVRPTRRR